MNVLVVGGTRFMGKHLVKELLRDGHQVTIATRGLANDDFSDKVNRLIIDRGSQQSIKSMLFDKHFDVIYDSLAYSSNDIKKLLDNIWCDKYITISSTAVYDKHLDIKEFEFNPLDKKLIWCDRADFPYDEVKRQAECALFQGYKNIKSVAVRFPFVIGNDDYTKRLYFYVEHILKQIPIFSDNFNYQMSFIRSNEAGKFLAYLADKDFYGVINGSCEGTISLNDIAKYVESKTGQKVILSKDGENAPYNGEVEYSINTEKAKELGFTFSNLKTWIYDLIDDYINEIN